MSKCAYCGAGFHEAVDALECRDLEIARLREHVRISDEIIARMLDVIVTARPIIGTSIGEQTSEQYARARQALAAYDRFADQDAAKAPRCDHRSDLCTDPVTHRCVCARCSRDEAFYACAKHAWANHDVRHNHQRTYPGHELQLRPVQNIK